MNSRQDIKRTGFLTHFTKLALRTFSPTMFKLGAGGLRPNGGYSQLITSSKTKPLGPDLVSKSTADYQVLDIEMDREPGGVLHRMSHCPDPDALCNGYGDGQIQLHKYDDVPSFLHGNPYVMDGYRVFLTSDRCLQSLFVWSNETINTWSHLIGFILFFFLMLWDNAVWIPNIGGTLMDHVILSVGLMCFQFCMLCSSGYHLFRCVSEHANMKWLALDLTGISVGLLGCYLPGVHYAFYCLSVWRDVYLIVISCLFAAVLFYQTRPSYYTDRWFRRRILLYCGLTGYGIIPTCHWIYLNGGFSAPVVQAFAPKVAIVYVLGVLAFFFYISKCPERCSPGTFDFVGSSHQVWHVIIVMAFAWWHYSGQQLLLFRTQIPCT